MATASCGQLKIPASGGKYGQPISYYLFCLGENEVHESIHVMVWLTSYQVLAIDLKFITKFRV